MSHIDLFTLMPATFWFYLYEVIKKLGAKPILLTGIGYVTYTNTKVCDNAIYYSLPQTLEKSSLFLISHHRHFRVQ